MKNKSRLNPQNSITIAIGVIAVIAIGSVIVWNGWNKSAKPPAKEADQSVPPEWREAIQFVKKNPLPLLRGMVLSVDQSKKELVMAVIDAPPGMMQGEKKTVHIQTSTKLAEWMLKPPAEIIALLEAYYRTVTDHPETPYPVIYSAEKNISLDAFKEKDVIAIMSSDDMKTLPAFQASSVARLVGLPSPIISQPPPPKNALQPSAQKK